MLFLIDYDRNAGKLIAMKTFADAERKIASDTRLALEIDQRQQGIEREVVLLDAASETALRKTHRRYFETWVQIAKSA